MAAAGVVDALTNTYTDIAKMKLLPDAQVHMQFLNGLEQGIMSYIQMHANATLGGSPGGGAAGIGGMGGGVGQGSLPPGMGAGGPPPSPGGGGMGMPGGGPPGMGGPPPMSIAPGGGAGMSGLMRPDLRQLLAARGGPGG